MILCQPSHYRFHHSALPTLMPKAWLPFTVCSMEACLLNVNPNPGGAHEGFDDPEPWSIPMPTGRISDVADGAEEVRGPMVPTLDIPRAIPAAPARVQKESMLQQVARRALAFITGRVDLSSVASALQNVITASTPLLSPATTPRGQAKGAAGSSFSQRFIHNAEDSNALAPVISSALEELKRKKRDFAADERAAAAMLINDQAHLPGHLSAQTPDRATKLAEAWARETFIAIRACAETSGLTSLPLHFKESPAAHTAAWSSNSIAGHLKTGASSSPDSGDEDTTESSDDAGQDRKSGNPSNRVFNASPHANLTGRRPGVVSPRSPAFFPDEPSLELRCAADSHAEISSVGGWQISTGAKSAHVHTPTSTSSIRVSASPRKPPTPDEIKQVNCKEHTH
jgi:hypothetical protein